MCRMDLPLKPRKVYGVGYQRVEEAMVRSNILLSGIFLLFVSSPWLCCAQSGTNMIISIQQREAGKECAVVTNDNAKLILEIFRAVEQRDEQRMHELFAPDLEMHWPNSLPYGGTHTASTPGPTTWAQTWTPLQPTEGERSMDPQVIATAGEEVVVLWRQRGVAPAGERFDGEVLGLYKLRNGKLTQAQMFYFDTVATANFLAKARLEMEKR